MKIQEMRSGLSHLPKSREAALPLEDFSDLISRDKPVMPERVHALTLAAGSELDASHWSVVSFSRREGSGLTYKQAARLMAELHDAHIAGLCIVTDTAAQHLDR